MGTGVFRPWRLTLSEYRILIKRKLAADKDRILNTYRYKADEIRYSGRPREDMLRALQTVTYERDQELAYIEGVERDVDGIHRRSVQKALRERRRIPEKVLRDYEGDLF